MGILFLLTAILCTSLFAVIFKLCQQRGVAAMPVILFNYVTATLVSIGAMAANMVVTSAPIESCLLPVPSMALALLQGAIFVAGFSVMNWATLRSGVALTTVLARSSLIVPVVISWLLLNQPRPAWLLIAIVIIAMMLIVLPGNKGATEKKSHGFVFALIGVFCIYGISDFSFKLIQHSIEVVFADNSLEIHLSALTCTMFLMASLLSLGVCALKGSLSRQHINRHTIFWGILLGLANLGCAFSILRALGEMPTGVFYPLYNVGTVIVATLTGVLIFKERIKPWQYVGLLLAIVAIVLLTA